MPRMDGLQLLGVVCEALHRQQVLAALLAEKARVVKFIHLEFKLREGLPPIYPLRVRT